MVRLCGFAPLIGERLFEMGRHSQADRMSPPEAQVAPLRSIPFHSIRFDSPLLQVLFLGIYLLICQLSINIDGAPTADGHVKKKKATLTLCRHLHEE